MSASRDTASVDSLAATCAIQAGLAGLLYSLAFLGLVAAGLAPAPGVVISSLMLLLGGLLSSFVLLVEYERVRPARPMLARWALPLGLGRRARGGPARWLRPCQRNQSARLGSDRPRRPAQSDRSARPTFGVSGLGALGVAVLIRRGGTLPRGLGSLGAVAGVLLVATYLGRLILLEPTHPLVAGPAALVGLIVNPAWYVWLARR